MERALLFGTLKSINECDVDDKGSLQAFRDLMDANTENLIGEDLHSVWHQVYHLLWSDTVYRTFNEARRLAAEVTPPDPALPGVLIEMIDRWFWDSQNLAIRRLLDKSERSGRRSVVSLPSLVGTVEKNIDLFTRENFVCYDGCPYDDSGDNPKVELFVNWRQSLFDRFAATGRSSRSRKQVVSQTFLKELRGYFDDLKTLKTLTDKFVAHASTQESRQEVRKEWLETWSLQAVENGYAELVKAARWTGRLFDVTIACDLAVAQFDVLDSWVPGICTERSYVKLHEYWDARAALIATWTQGI